MSRLASPLGVCAVVVCVCVCVPGMDGACAEPRGRTCVHCAQAGATAVGVCSDCLPAFAWCVPWFGHTAKACLLVSAHNSLLQANHAHVNPVFFFFM